MPDRKKDLGAKKLLRQTLALCRDTQPTKKARRIPRKTQQQLREVIEKMTPRQLEQARQLFGFEK